MRKHNSNKYNFFNNTSGFTLLELIVSFSLFAILVVAIVPIFKQGNDFWQLTGNQVHLRQSLNSALQVMAREIRQAEKVELNGLATNEFVKYRVTSAGGSPWKTFSLEGTTNRYIALKSGSPPVGTPVTPEHGINITNALVTQEVYTPTYEVWKITLEGQYQGENLRVETKVVPRINQDIQSWQEDN